MRTHTLTVGRYAEADDRTIIQGAQREDRVALSLSDEWAGLTVKATFTDRHGNSVTPEVEDGLVDFPPECNALTGTVDCAVQGTSGDGTVMRHAVMSKPFVVVPSGTAAGVAPADPTVSEYEAAYLAAKEATAEAENVNATLDGTVLTVTDRDGVSTSVDTKGEKGDRGDCEFAAFEIVDGTLVAHYTSDENAITFELRDGILYVQFFKEA